jgi:hypothetical protein
MIAVIRASFADVRRHRIRVSQRADGAPSSRWNGS